MGSLPTWDSLWLYDFTGYSFVFKHQTLILRVQSLCLYSKATSHTIIFCFNTGHVTLSFKHDMVFKLTKVVLEGV